MQEGQKKEWTGEKETRTTEEKFERISLTVSRLEFEQLVLQCKTMKHRIDELSSKIGANVTVDPNISWIQAVPDNLRELEEKQVDYDKVIRRIDTEIMEISGRIRRIENSVFRKELE
jgi:hypothetical protein